MQFRMNNVHVASVSDDLLVHYRKLMKIPKDVTNFQLIKDIIYKDILCRDFIPDEFEKSIRALKKFAQVHYFDTVGRFIEYIMRQQMESKLPICKNCSLWIDDGYCADHWCFVNGLSLQCNEEPSITYDTLPSALKEALSKMTQKEDC